MMVMRKSAFLGIPVIVTAFAFPVFGQTELPSLDSFVPKGPPPSSSESSGRGDSPVSEPEKAASKAATEKSPRFLVQIKLKRSGAATGKRSAPAVSSHQDNIPSLPKVAPSNGLGTIDPPVVFSPVTRVIEHDGTKKTVTEFVEVIRTPPSSLTLACNQLVLSSRVDEQGTVEHEFTASGDAQLFMAPGIRINAKEIQLKGETLTLTSAEVILPNGSLKSDQMELNVTVQSISTSPWQSEPPIQLVPLTPPSKDAPPGNSPYRPQSGKNIPG